ncbi:MAG: hypothetical protein HOA33_05850 [Gammaproteobacteria bacterium]|nr:hypothetical protein [Gammaproteobacteria bacterium]MBT4583189.1 hypothetical protein [Gammaproteobacteria bacterium]MBT4660203.1 hypothetical protein [Gammaproteobacteria bacterium]MBT4893818.1 hypothetical protein [Gammaproteobacteria bacterium]MBT5172745.1 hypothetical protein [Gammaproteobacteria bacterium]
MSPESPSTTVESESESESEPVPVSVPVPESEPLAALSPESSGAKSSSGSSTSSDRRPNTCPSFSCKQSKESVEQEIEFGESSSTGLIDNADLVSSLSVSARVVLVLVSGEVEAISSGEGDSKERLLSSLESSLLLAAAAKTELSAACVLAGFCALSVFPGWFVPPSESSVSPF